MVATTLMRLRLLLGICLVLLMGAAACGKTPPPVARPTPPAPPPPPATAPLPPQPPAPAREPMPAQPLPSDDVSGRSLDDLNRDSPLQPVFFDYDSSDINDASRTTLQANAAVLKKYPTWVVTIEGHCDERGTAVDSGSWRTARRCGADLSHLARARREPAAHGELWERVPVRSRAPGHLRGAATAARIS